MRHEIVVERILVTWSLLTSAPLPQSNAVFHPTVLKSFVKILSLASLQILANPHPSWHGIAGFPYRQIARAQVYA